MRAARAQHRPARRQRLAQRLYRRQRRAQRLAHLVGRKLAQQPRQVLSAVDPHARGAQNLLHKRVELLHDIELVDLFREGANGLYRQGIDHARLKYAGVGERLAHVQIGRAGAHKADLAAAQLLAVEFSPLAEGAPRPPCALPGSRETWPRSREWRRTCGDFSHTPAAAAPRAARSPPGSASAPRGCRCAKARGVKRLGDLVGALGKFQALGRVRRLEHGSLAARSVVARVLLVLRGMGSPDRRRR